MNRATRRQMVRRGADSPAAKPRLQPMMDNGGRWSHLASDHEVSRAIVDKEAEVIEAPGISMTFVVSYQHLTVLRCGAMGGDTFNVEGGWVYPSDLAMRFDVQEMRQVAEATKR